MDEEKENQCKKVGLQQSVIFATFGWGAALLLLALMFGIRIAIELPLRYITSIFIAFTALYLGAAIFGRIAGKWICEFKGQSFKIGLAGIMLAESCLLISTLAGSSVEFIAHLNYPGSFADYIIKPVFWVIIFGSIPALILGIIYSHIVARLIAAK